MFKKVIQSLVLYQRVVQQDECNISWSHRGILNRSSHLVSMYIQYLLWCSNWCCCCFLRKAPTLSLALVAAA